MKVSSFVRASFAALALIALSGCGWVAPDANQAGVLTRKPWFFGHGGVDPQPVTTGRSVVAWSTHVDYVDLNPTAFVIQYNDMMSKDGIPLDFAATAILQVTDPVALVANFGGALNDINGQKAWYVNNIEPVENNMVRDAFHNETMNAVAIDATGAVTVENTVRKQLEHYIAVNHIPVRVVNFVLGRVNPPQSIKKQRTLTAEETQRQQTEQQTQKAEEFRKAAEQARAAADDVYRTEMNLSPEQFVELQRIKMMQNVCDNKACTFIVGNASALVNTASK